MGTTNPFIELMLITSTHANPKENLTREQAVIAYTRTNAFAEFMESEKGMLKKGMLADLAVLSQDIFTIPAEQLPTTHSVMTLVDGIIVYQLPQMPTRQE
jgi:predicted amidohydrolase YtcJ